MKWIFQLIFELLLPMSTQLKQIQEEQAEMKIQLHAIKDELDKTSAELEAYIKAQQVQDVASFNPTMDSIEKQ